jgi:hypothetical protein
MAQRLLRRQCGMALPPFPPGLRARAGYPCWARSSLCGGDPLSFLTRVAREYGDVVHLRVGLVDAYLVTHPDYAKEVLSASPSPSSGWKGRSSWPLSLGGGAFASFRGHRLSPCPSSPCGRTGACG